MPATVFSYPRPIRPNKCARTASHRSRRANHTAFRPHLRALELTEIFPSPVFFFFQQHGVEFGHGILNKGGAKKREKRPLTQIEIMAALEREKTQKKAARKAAKVREPPTFPGPTRSPDRRDPHKKKIISSIDQFSDPRRTHAAYSPTDVPCSPNPPSTTTGGQEGGPPRQGGVRPDRRKQETDQEGTQEARTR